MFSSGVIVVRPSSKYVVSPFLFFFFFSFSREKKRRRRGKDRKRIDVDTFARIPIIYPRL